mgnify:CR=1 FL=1
MISADINWLQQTLKNEIKQSIHLTEHDLSNSIEFISTDSRTISENQVFVALTGPNFDGSKFIKEVQAKGAIAVVTQTLDPSVKVPQFLVDNTLTAYGKISAQVAKESDVKTIAITGSVGKTSVKEMCAAILAHKVSLVHKASLAHKKTGNNEAAQQSNKVLATQGNFNNEVGVPHTLMRFNPELEFAVVELGANHIGEIAYTTNLTQPDVAVLNNVGEAHLEGFGSLMGVVQAKGEIYQGLSENGIAVVNADSEYKEHWLSKLRTQFSEPESHILQFSTDPNNAGQSGFIVSDNIELNELACAKFDLLYQQQSISIQLPIPGRHNVANALAASAACLALGVSLSDIKHGLQNMGSVKGRVNINKVSEQLLIIDDSYNANVKSVNAASDLLSNYEGVKVLTLGDMGELGDEGTSLHQQVGVYAMNVGIDFLFSFGELSQFASDAFGEGEHFSEQTLLTKKIIETINDTKGKITVLVKGSRSAKMENVVNALITHYKNNNKG